MPPKKKAVQVVANNEFVGWKDWKWSKEGSCYIGQSQGLKASSKIASFDMDDTLIAVKSGAKFAKDAADWNFLSDKVTPTLLSLSKQGFKIVIFTNQMGVEKGKTNIQHLKIKVANIARIVGVQMQVFIATSQDQYRKPSTGMWRLLKKNNENIQIQLKNSFFCGDAAGRTGKHKDFSDSDLKFALNVGITFKTPQNLYDNDKTQIQVQGFKPTQISDNGKLFKEKDDKKVEFVEKQMVIFVGSPASGKSTFWKNYMQQYSRVNRDTLKTKEKCYKVAQEEINKGKSVIIDNTNPKKQDRKYFIDLAKKNGYKVRCFVFETSKDVCFHNDYQRRVNKVRKHLSQKVGTIPIHTFFKYKEQPQLNEGFYEINHVNFIAHFENEIDKKAYQQYSNV